MAALSSVCFATFLGIYPFLAITERVDADVLVVEGWIGNYAIEAALGEYNASPYRQVLSTGGPIVGTRGYTNDYNTSASVGADLLIKAGIPKESVQMVPSKINSRSRTFTSAVALRNWFESHREEVHAVNVLTEAPHARRTRLLFQKALGNKVKVGIIGVANPDYAPSEWWRFSEGVREVLGEGIAYLYAKVAFLD